ncbi:uncharacterized protein TNCV_178791 [Trichonephila clavipes]|nr:uncharacterized protein TNCV_178791 [Trichonephila clavipes]
MNRRGTLLSFSSISGESPISFPEDTSMPSSGFEPTRLQAECHRYCVNKPVFFVETSSSTNLTPRQACAVESTARHNPSLQINVLMTPISGINANGTLIKKLQNISNVQIIHININELVCGTPIWNWYVSGKWKRSEWKGVHPSMEFRRMASRFGENSLRNSCLAFIQLSFNYLQQRRGSDATRGLLATDHVILNHGQVMWMTPELAPPLLTTTPHQREDVSALDRFNVHRCPTRRVFSGTGFEPVTKQATVRYLYHSATAATGGN